MNVKNVMSSNGKGRVLSAVIALVFMANLQVSCSHSTETDAGGAVKETYNVDVSRKSVLQPEAGQ